MFGLEPMAIIFSLPWALLMWSYVISSFRTLLYQYLLNCSSPPEQVGDIFRRAVALWIRCLEQLDANNCRCDVGPRGCPHRRVHLGHLGVWK